MKKLLLVIAFFVLTINTSNAETFFINKGNAKIITVQQVKDALNNGADIKAVNNKGDTGLMLAIIGDANIRVIKLLLQHGANINAKDYGHITPLIWASVANVNPEVVSLLLKHGANIHAVDSNEDTSLLMATMYNKNSNNIQIIKILLKHGAKPSKKLLHYIDTKCKNGAIIELFNKYPR